MDECGAHKMVREAHEARRRGEYEEAIGLLRNVLAERPGDALALREMAMVTSIVGDRGHAVELMSRAMPGHEGDASWQYDLGDLCARAGRLAEARRAFEAAASLAPGEAMYAGRLAMLCRRLRDWPGARAAAERALALDAREGYALQVMGEACLREGELDEAERLARRLAEDATGAGRAASAWHLLGRVLEIRERWDDAFDAHMRANAAKLATPAARAALRDERLRRFPHYLGHGDGPERYASWGRKRYDDAVPDPVILTGFPRSGTTMVEQMLNAHPRVTTGDEVEMMGPIEAELARMIGDAGWRGWLGTLDDLTDAQAGRLRALYRTGLERGIAGAGEGRLLVDKHPLRVIDLGLINRLFPGARVIMMIRDPRDVCVSALFQDFDVNAGMVRFLSPELCADWYARVMGFWLRLREMLSIEVLEVRYEDVVGDFESWARRLVEFAGLAWDGAVSDFHEAARGRVVRSASYEAVTERVHSGSVGRWERYAHRFAPVMDRLAPFVETFGYDSGGRALDG
jgi:tetratricopeptide (TPR) repeat protein